jgi:hypothetical protein
MADFKIKSGAGSGNKTLLQGQDQVDSAYAIEIGDAGATTLTNATITAGSLASGVTGGSGLTGSTSLGTVTAGNIDAISALVYMGKAVASSQAIVEFKHNVAVTGGTPDFSSDYCAHLFIVENIAPTTNGGQMRCRYSTDLGSSYVDTGYDGFSEHGDADNDTNLQSTDAYRLGTSVKGTGESGGSEGQSGQCWLYGASNVKTSLLHFDMIWHRNDTTAFYSIRGQYWSTSAGSPVDIDALKFFFHSGNVTSGTIRMYGLKA